MDVSSGVMFFGKNDGLFLGLGLVDVHEWLDDFCDINVLPAGVRSDEIDAVCRSFTAVSILAKSRIYVKSVFQPDFVAISVPDREVPIRLLAGEKHFIVLTGGRRVFVFTDDASKILYSQLGTEGTVGDFELAEVFLPDGDLARSISVGTYSNYAIGVSNKLYGWGRNESHRMGLPDDLANYQTPTLIAEDVDEAWMNWSAHSFIRKGQSIYAVGWNEYGQLGLGDTDTRSEFTKIDLPAGVLAENCEFVLNQKTTALRDTKSGRIWAAGFYCGRKTLTFTELDRFKSDRAVSVSSTSWEIYVLSERGEVTNLRENRGSHPVPGGTCVHHMSIVCGSEDSCFLFRKLPNLSSDIRRLVLDPGPFADTDLFFEGAREPLKVIGALLYARLASLGLSKLDGLGFEDLVKKAVEIIGRHPRDVVLDFLNWVYSGYPVFIENVNLVLQSLTAGDAPPAAVWVGWARLGDDLHRLLEEGVRTDMAIRALDYEEDGHKYYYDLPVHKFVLYARTSYFRALFSEELPVARQSDVIDAPDGTTADLVEVFLRFLYMGDIEIDADSEDIERDRDDVLFIMNLYGMSQRSLTDYLWLSMRPGLK